MGLTELFNEWIIERGSAKVQEKHIALFRDKLALSDKKIAELEAEVTVLERKLENAQTTIQELTVENEILRSKVQEHENLAKSTKKQDRAEPWSPFDEM